MAGKRISDYPVNSTLTGTEKLLLEQGGSGVYKQVNPQDIPWQVRRVANLSVGQGVAHKIAGRYIDAQFLNSTASSVQAGSVNLCRLMPLPVYEAFSIDLAGISVTGASSTSPHTARIGIYKSSGNGVPDTLMGSVDISGLNSTGFQSAGFPFTFERDTLYWIALHFNSNPTARCAVAAACMPLGYTTGNEANHYVSIQRTITYASGLPASWVFSAAELTTALPWLVRMRTM